MNKIPKNIAILGSTGSIGTQTLEAVRSSNGRFLVTGIVGHSNVGLIKAQKEEFSVKIAGSTKHNEKGLFFGEEAVLAAIESADIVICANSGMAGFRGVCRAIEKKKRVLLANKEALVAGGKYIMGLAKKNGVEIIPLDSEHSTIFQCLNNAQCSIHNAKDTACSVQCSTQDAKLNKGLKRIILTASGGPFYGKDKQFLEKATVEMALKHPTWKMGKKISIDSATMMNKGLEIIEAYHLFNTKNIDFVIHPESIIHSLVEFVDGTMLAGLSPPSMLFPISYALNYPKRQLNNLSSFSFDKSLSFFNKDEENFPATKFCKEALDLHSGAPLVLNAVNEAAVSLFLNKKISFTYIYTLLEKALTDGKFPKVDTEEEIESAHTEWYNKTIKENN